jgi:hypothetical protein
LCGEYNVPADIEMQMFGDDQRSGSLAKESNHKDNDGKVIYETTPLSVNSNLSIHEISFVETNKESAKENHKPCDQLIVSNNQRHNQNSLQQTNLIGPQSIDQVEPNCDSNAQQTEFTTYANDNLSNCLEQRQIPSITIADPVFCHAIKPNPISPTFVSKLNLPLIEFRKSNNYTEQKNQHNMLQPPFWKSTLSHPTRCRAKAFYPTRVNPRVRKRIVHEIHLRSKPTTNEWKCPTRLQVSPQASSKRTVSETDLRFKPTINEWKRYLRYVRQTIG